MADLDERTEIFLYGDECERVQEYFDLLHPDYFELSFDEKWYTEWDKLFIDEHLAEMDYQVERIISSGDMSDEARIVRVAYRGLLTDHYYSMVEDNEDISWDFILENLDTVNKKYLDRWFYCNYNSIPFDSSEELTSIVGEIKADNRSMKKEDNN